MNSTLAISALMFSALAAQEVSAPVLVENEPLHHVVLKNESVIVMHLSLPAGARTQYHTHTRDRVAIELSANSTAQQMWNEKESAPSYVMPGDFSVITAPAKPFTHRMHNVGSSSFEVLDVELFHRPDTISTAIASAPAGENPSARVYKWVLAPGATSALHIHARPFLIVAATACNLKMTTPDGQSFTQKLKAGDFHWVDTRVSHSLGNAGSVGGQILEVELK